MFLIPTTGKVTVKFFLYKVDSFYLFITSSNYTHMHTCVYIDQTQPLCKCKERTRLGSFSSHMQQEDSRTSTLSY